jgi:4-amino-4-deoxy-L-arabinose transferase-like glycosyltransferase
MSGVPEGTADAPIKAAPRLTGPAVLLLALAVRVAQLAFAAVSPLIYELGPDEDYYQRFGQAVAAWHGQNAPEFTFMDPGYGFLLGGIFRLLGSNLFIVLLLQAFVDAATAFGILVAGRLLGRPRAGLYAAVMYALCTSALALSTSLLKEVWVVSFVTWWAVTALALLRAPRWWGWLGFGVLCGVGIALRSTMLLLALCGLLLPVFYRAEAPRAGATRRVTGVAIGLLAALLPWSWRNHAAFGGLSPLPTNSGIVLHQVYNDRNPQADLSFPEFVHFPRPSDVWRGYAAEASRRLDIPLNPMQIDRYWRGEALAFIVGHPGAVAADIWRKNLFWFISHEFSAGGSDVDQKRFSPLLRAIPPSGIWLLAVGLAGLVCLSRTDRRWPIIAAPIACAWLGVVVLVPEARFRFHAASMLALCGGVALDETLQSWRIPTLRLRAVAVVAVVIVVASMALVLGHRIPERSPRWNRIAWGYVRMGRDAQALEAAGQAARENPGDDTPLEILGYIKAARKDYAGAAAALQRAISLRPDSPLAHYNLSEVYLATGEREQAAVEARAAFALEPSEHNRALLQRTGSGYDSGGSNGGNDPSMSATESP